MILLSLTTRKEGDHEDPTPKMCKESISVSWFHLEFTGLPSTTDLLFSLHLKIKPRASALTLSTKFSSSTHPRLCLCAKMDDWTLKTF